MPQPYIDFAFVKENASFERVLEHYNLPMRGTAMQRSISCPFHPDKRPSCRVELDKKIWHCFACEASGNVLEFVAKMEGDADDLRAAAIKLADICSIATAASRGKPAAGARQAAQHSRKGAGRTKPQPEAQTPSPAPPAASDGPINPPLSFELKLDSHHPYLAERGLSAEIVAEFSLGYCHRGLMAGRICIPIHNGVGELVAYAGRWPGEIPEGIDRYRLPPKFEKNRVLFNLHRLTDSEHLVLVEGFWSMLRERGTRYLTILWDGDDAGRKARERALPVLANGFFVRAPLLPDGQKPDSLPEHALRALVDLG